MERGRGIFIFWLGDFMGGGGGGGRATCLSMGNYPRTG